MSKKKHLINDMLRNAQFDLQQAMLALDELPSIDKERIWTVSHSIGNYLTVTHAAVELLRSELVDHPSKEVHHWLKCLDRAGEQMLRVTGMLTTQEDDMESAYHLETINLSEGLERSGRYYRSMAEPKNIAVNVMPVQDPHWVIADRVALGVVFDNLLSNAVKYSPFETTISVYLAQKDEEVVLKVEDQGPGISSEDQKRLFQKGQKLTHRPTNNEPSHGYGLAISKNIIECFGGRIWCESEEGEGSTFCIALKEAHPPAED